MKFNQWSLRRLKLGVKDLTSRNTPHYDDPEVKYVVGPLPWKFIRDYLFRYEGALCPEELQRIINQVQRRKVPDDKELYVHVLDVEAIIKNHFFIFEEAEELLK